MWLTTLACVLCVLQTAEQVQVWFHSRQAFLCHCVNSQCNPDGQCKSGSKCARGWFGKTCQYVDLLGHYNNIHILTDNDESTCLGVATEIVVLPLGTDYPTVQMRLVYKKGVKDITTPDTVFGCGSRKYHVDNEVVDYFCDNHTSVYEIILTGKTLHNLCSVYFSGGRNVALNQHVKQSSSYSSEFSASAAVDGISENCGYTFSHTNDSNPWFQLQFCKAVTINRVRIFNRGDDPRLGSGLGYRLKGFEMAVFDSGSNVLFRYKDTREVQMVYNLDLKLLKGVTKIDFEQKEKYASDSMPYITICELEVFGDCDNGFWGLDCQKCNGLCPKACHRETGQCEESTIAVADDVQT